MIFGGKKKGQKRFIGMFKKLTKAKKRLQYLPKPIYMPKRQPN